MTVIVSMTTLPSRKALIVDTLRTLKLQTVQPDRICIYGCGGATAPEFDYPIVTFYPSHDAGPVTKVSAVFTHGLDRNDIVITVDDDILYQPTWLETLLAGAARHPESAVGFAGWFAPHLIAHRQFHFTKEAGPTDVLEGWAGVAYRVKFFREMEHVEGSRNIPSPTHILYPPDHMRVVDDVWISGYLGVRGIERRVIATPLSQENRPGHPGLHHRPDFKSYNVCAAQWWSTFGAWSKS